MLRGGKGLGARHFKVEDLERSELSVIATVRILLSKRRKAVVRRDERLTKKGLLVRRGRRKKDAIAPLILLVTKSFRHCAGGDRLL